MTKIAEQLKILAIFHYVVGGLHALQVLLIGLSFGAGLGFGLFAQKTTAGTPALDPRTQQIIFWVTGAVGGIMVLIGAVESILTILSGRFIQQRRRRYFSLVIASINLLFIPFGTVLGIFSFIFLRKEEAMWWYAGGGREESEQ